MDRKYAEYVLKKTKEDYNLLAEEFSSTRERVWEEIEFLFNNYLNSGDKVLDLGCGNGRYYPLFQKSHVDYFGTDISEKLIEIAKENYPEGKFQMNEDLKIPFPDIFFDKIYSIAVLHHIPSEEYRLQFLNEIKRVLKKSGLIVLTVWKFHQPKELYLLFKYTILKIIGKSKLDWKETFEPWGKKTERYYHYFSKEELEDLFKKSGFEVKKTGITKNLRGNRQNIYLIAQKPL
jgi:ubiquinone/menaquinone biosynthesis C-methylase UbiE